MKNTVSEMIIKLEGIKSRPYEVEVWISELGDKKEQTNPERETKWKKTQKEWRYFNGYGGQHET